MKKSLLLIALPILAIASSVSLFNANAEGSSSKVQILKFEADWCGPCQQMKPVFNQVSRSMASSASFRSINVDNQPSVADAYQVRGLPTVIAIKDGKVVGREMGFMSSRKLKAFVKRHR